MRLADFDALTFDCYGTLIDWETGILAALRPLLARCVRAPGPDAALSDFAGHETALEASDPRLNYRDLLAAVHGRLARDWGVAPDPMESRQFGQSVPDWPAFADTTTALQYLKRHYKLVILSNVDRQSFAASNRRIGVDFDAVYTAEDIGSYKPSPQNFTYMLRRLQTDFGIGQSRILHTAQSLFHDHVPTTALGLATNWIDRRGGKAGWGATAEPANRPQVNFRFDSLEAFAAAHRAELGH